MKAYSQPEALEDHIAPAVIIPGSEINLGPEDAATPSLADNLSEFEVETVRVGADAPSVEVTSFNFQDPSFQALLGDTGIQSALPDATFSLLTEEITIPNGVMEAIEPAVTAMGSDLSIALVGLSADEFRRTSGSAFLTSL